MFAPIFDKVKESVDQVSMRKLYDYQEKLFAFDIKYITLPGNKLAAEYIFNQFKSFGYEPEYQYFEARNVRTANVLATLRGTENPELVYVLSSHFDSNRRSPGADDNSSAVAVLLETARILKKNPLPATIIFAAFTGEEAGLLGSRFFVDEAVRTNMKLEGAINNDMIGWCNDHHLDNTIRYSNAGIRDIQHAGAFLFSKMITYDAHYYRSTDAAAYYEKFGDIVGGIGSYPVLGNPYYHQSTDLLETVNQQLLYEAAKANIAAMIYLASSPSRIRGLKAEWKENDKLHVSWEPSPEKKIRSYSVKYGDKAGLKKIIISVKPQIDINIDKNQIVGDNIIVNVTAFNSAGLEGWDGATLSVKIK